MDSNVTISLADPGGAASAPHLPTGSISFIFAYVFAKKYVLEVRTPPMGWCPPQWEILDPQLNIVVNATCE